MLSESCQEYTLIFNPSLENGMLRN